MRQIMNVNGGVLHSARAYDIAPGTAIRAGQVVKLAAGRVVPADGAETGAILGYAAEHHSGVGDMLNPRSTGTKLLVEDGPGAVAESAAPVLTATGGTETTLTAGGVGAFAANAFQGGFVQAAGGGALRAITASAVAGGVLTLTLETGAVPQAGETYRVFPPCGFATGGLAADGCRLTLSAAGALPLVVMGRDETRGMIWTVATKHALAARGV